MQIWPDYPKVYYGPAGDIYQPCPKCGSYTHELTIQSNGKCNDCSSDKWTQLEFDFERGESP
jgi:hypothetical protein